MNLYLCYLEMNELGYDSRKNHIERITRWSKYLKDKLPNKYRFSMTPLSFNYVDELSISRYIENSCADFLKVINLKLVLKKESFCHLYS